MLIKGLNDMLSDKKDTIYNEEYSVDSEMGKLAMQELNGLLKNG